MARHVVSHCMALKSILCFMKRCSAVQIDWITFHNAISLSLSLYVIDTYTHIPTLPTVDYNYTLNKCGPLLKLFIYLLFKVFLYLLFLTESSIDLHQATYFYPHHTNSYFPLDALDQKSIKTVQAVQLHCGLRQGCGAQRRQCVGWRLGSCE